MLTEVKIIVIFLGNFMFISFLIFSFFVFCFPFGLKAADGSLPLAIAVGVEGSLGTMVRGSSVISSFVGSQPSVFSQDEIVTPICDEDPDIVAAPAVKSPQDDSLVRVLYDSALAGGKAIGDSSRALELMAKRGDCSARLAVAILYNMRKENFEMDQEEVLRNLEEAYPVFLSYENTSPEVYAHWNRLLAEHDLKK